MSRLILLYLLSLTVRSLVFAAVAELILLRSRRVHVRHAKWALVLCSLFLMPVTDTLLPSAMVPAVVPEVNRSASGIRRLSDTGGSATVPYRKHRFSRTSKRLVESCTHSYRACLLCAALPADARSSGRFSSSRKRNASPCFGYGLG